MIRVNLNMCTSRVPSPVTDFLLADPPITAMDLRAPGVAVLFSVLVLPKMKVDGFAGVLSLDAWNVTVLAAGLLGFGEKKLVLFFVGLDSCCCIEVQ